jgi:hypothetical protein
MFGTKRKALLRTSTSGRRRRPLRCCCCLTRRTLPWTLLATALSTIYYEEILVSMMPHLLPSAPAGAAAHLAPAAEDGLTGYWKRMDVRDAAGLTEDEFEREYMNKGLPVVIRNDPGALAVSRRVNVSTLLASCGDREPELGRRLVEPLKALPGVIKLELSRWGGCTS